MYKITLGRDDLGMREHGVYSIVEQSEWFGARSTPNKFECRGRGRSAWCRKAAFSNEVGRCKRFFFCVLASWRHTKVTVDFIDPEDNVSCGVAAAAITGTHIRALTS